MRTFKSRTAPCPSSVSPVVPRGATPSFEHDSCPACTRTLSAAESAFSNTSPHLNGQAYPRAGLLLWQSCYLFFFLFLLLVFLVFVVVFCCFFVLFLFFFLFC